MAWSRNRALSLLTAMLAAASAEAVSLGQIDDFQDGTPQGWTSGPINPNPPINLPDVGPAGLGDDSLQITSTGIIGPGGRFVAFNGAQWTGDYPTAGVDLIVLDVNNVGPVALNLRVALDGPGGRFVTTSSVPVSVGSGWRLVGLSIRPGDLSSAGGFDVGATLGGVTQLRLISALNPTFQGDTIAAQALVDNVLAAPEPAESVLLGSGLGLVALLARRRALAKGRSATAGAPFDYGTVSTSMPNSRRSSSSSTG